MDPISMGIGALFLHRLGQAAVTSDALPPQSEEHFWVGESPVLLKHDFSQMYGFFPQSSPFFKDSGL